MAETILSYLLGEESSNRQRISTKMGGLGSGEDGISPIPCGSGMENGKTWPRPSYRICWRRRVAIRKGFRKNGRSGIRRRRHLSYNLWVGDGEWEDMSETILSYLLAEESSNPQRISKKWAVWESGEDGISPIPCGSGMENGKTRDHISLGREPETIEREPG